MNANGIKALARALRRDESGAVATEYAILLATMISAFVWFNKTADTLLFGDDIYARFANPAEVDDIPVYRSDFDDGLLTGDHQGFDESFIDVLRYVGGDQQGDNRRDRSHVGQIQYHLSLP